MWREDDFEDKGKRIKIVPKDVPNDESAGVDQRPAIESDGKVGRSDERAQESSHLAP